MNRGVCIGHSCARTTLSFELVGQWMIDAETMDMMLIWTEVHRDRGNCPATTHFRLKPADVDSEGGGW